MDEQITSQEIANLLLRIYEIPERLIAEHGALEGLRDGTMLHAAVARPFATWAGEPLYPSEWEKAAALFHSLIKSHPFMDGTKRTAFASALYLLNDYGHSIDIERLAMDQVIRFCIEVAEENMRRARGETVEVKSIPEIAAWFRY